MTTADYTILVPLVGDRLAARELLEIAAALIPVHAGEARVRVVGLGIV